MFQLTQLTVGSALNISYAYSATQNNGKITSQTDALSGEQVLYTYDSLNRLASAQTAGAGGWGQSYTYDGFGNLTDQTLIKGTAPDVHVAYNYLTNLQTGDTADANGNIGVGYNYDMDNRLVQPGSSSTARYAYDVANKRVWRGDTGVDEIVFWAGQKMATYQITNTGSLMSFALTSTNVYFGGKLISKGTYNVSGSGDYVSLTAVAADRLGSIGKFYPYGVERPSATANDKEKFTGYFRDASTGLDYADQRYEQPGMGRFMTPDPYGGSAGASDPGSWNRYAYVGGDPVNRTDPTGQCYDQEGVSYACWSDLPSYIGGFRPARSIFEGEASDLFYQRIAHHNALNNLLHRQIAEAIRNLSPECQTALGGVGINLDQVALNAANTIYYDARSRSPEGSYTYGGTTGFPSDATLSDLLGDSIATTLRGAQNLETGGYPIINSVVVGQKFFDENAAQRNVTLLHEALHTSLGLNDAQVVNRLGLGVVDDTTPDGVNFASQVISLYLLPVSEGGSNCGSMR